MSRERGFALGALALVYPFICLVISVLSAFTPSTQEFMGAEVSMSLQQGFANWLFNNFVSAPIIAMCVIVSVAIFYLAFKSNRY